MKYAFHNIKFWLLGNIKKYLPFLSNYIRSTTSIISINYNSHTVEKKLIRYINFNLIENEKRWLIKLKSSTHTPKVISSSKNKLTLTYAGEPMNSCNLPKDWKNQAEEILNDLKTIDCSHNDIKPTDLLILNKKIMLIDFQWATKINDPIPNNWPDCIGGQYKYKNKFNDSYSIYKSIQSII